MNDTTDTASVLDAQRAEDLRRQVALRARRVERAADPGLRAAVTAPAPVVAAAARPHRFFTWRRRSPRRATLLAAR